MSRYRQTMSEAYAQVQVNENDYLKSKLTDTQIANIKQLWKTKTARDVTPSVKDMIKKMDIPTQLAIKHANINQLSKLVETLDESFSDAQIAVLKKEYEPMRGKTISMANANKLGQLFTKFDSNKNALEKLYGGNIPFVSTMAMTRLMTKHGYKADQLNKIRKEELEEELFAEGVGHISGFRDDKEKANMISLAKQHGLKVDSSGPKLKLSGNMRKILDMQLAAQGNGLKAEEFRLSLDEGKMSQIDQMQKDGKSAAEIAKLMKLDVKTVKSILGEVKEETLHEFKKMTVTFKSMADMAKASTDLAKHGFTINAKGMVMKVDGKGADLNKYATDLKNFYKADIRAESYSIDESADEDNYNPITEACWVGYKKVGMKKKGDKMVPNCVPEETIKEEDDPNKLSNELKQKEEDRKNSIASGKQKLLDLGLTEEEVKALIGV